MNIRDAQRPVDARVPAEARGEAPVRVFSTDIMAFNGSVAMVPARGDAFTAAFSRVDLSLHYRPAPRTSGFQLCAGAVAQRSARPSGENTAS